jgi:hypothetical protein
MTIIRHYRLSFTTPPNHLQAFFSSSSSRRRCQNQSDVAENPSDRHIDQDLIFTKKKLKPEQEESERDDEI